MRYWLLAGWFSLLALSSPLRAEDGEMNSHGILPSQKALEEAARLKAAGQYDEAVRLWERVWTADAKSPFAADALYLAGETMEEMGRYSEAEGSYRRLLAGYPTHRLAPRARRRLDHLAQNRQTGDEPLREYQDILNRYFQLDPAQAIQRMEGVIARYPDFALGPKAMLWVADRYMERERYDDAVRWFDRYLLHEPRGEGAVDAFEGKGSALSRQHRYVEAALVFESMKSLSPVAAIRAEGLLKRSRSHQVRRNVFFLGFLPFQLMCLAAVGLFMPWRRLTRSHTAGALKEAAFVTPLLLALYAILARRNPFTARGLLVLLVAVPPAVFLNSLYAQAGPMPRCFRWIYPAVGLCFMAGLVYGVFYVFDLVFVVEQIWGGEVEWQ